MALLVRGATLTPSDEGMGTHKQMGLATCSWVAEGSGPCVTCGMTTAVSLAAHGRIGAAFAAQPAGALLALLAAMTCWVCGYTMWTGCPAVREVRVLWRPMTWAVAVAVVVAAWAYKMAIS